MILKRKTIKNINKTQNWFFENIDQIAKFIARLIEGGKREKTKKLQIPEINDEMSLLILWTLKL